MNSFRFLSSLMLLGLAFFGIAYGKSDKGTVAWDKDYPKVGVASIIGKGTFATGNGYDFDEISLFAVNKATNKEYFKKATVKSSDGFKTGTWDATASNLPAGMYDVRVEFWVSFMGTSFVTVKRILSLG